MLKAIKLEGVKERIINQDASPFIIAEIGSNHNQDIELAKEMIRISANCGVDAVKFQSLNLEKQYTHSARNEDLNKLFFKIKLEESWYSILAEEASKVGVYFFSAPTYIDSIKLLEDVNVSLYKLASPQVRTFPKLIKEVAALGKPIIMSVGYCTYSQIETAVNLCLEQGNDKLILQHCVSEYPTNFNKVNLRSMNTLGNMFDCQVGLSDHTLGYEVPCGAVAMGAVVIEKHLTLSRKMEGPDHYFALEPNEFKNMVKAVRNVYLSLGSSCKVVTQHEKKFANNILVRWFANNDISIGDKIVEENLKWQRGSYGIPDENYMLLGSLEATRNIKKGEPIKWCDVKINKEG